MKSAEIRKAFSSFFSKKNHKVIPSASLVPEGDPTLLFTNAGMNQFKNIFLGERSSFKRAVTAQRCVRAGGKHNDLNNVGYTARHHTFFEMLGNFSFGDYFKREAIQFAWEFLTKELKIDPSKLWVTVYKDDIESEAIWINEMGVDPARFSKLGDDDNFWSMGNTGPCGPCSEIFFDHGSAIAGDPPGGENDDGDRYVEIWNMVFMEYNRCQDGGLEKLPKPSIDTGMGLERISAVMQGVHNNYDTDLFVPIVNVIKSFVPNTLKESDLSSLRVIADHIRSCVFLIADGVTPSNTGRGYVLRRIIRRACRHGHKLGIKEIFFYQLTPILIEVMGSAAEYITPEKQQFIVDTLRTEETLFAKTIDKGMDVLLARIANLKAGDVVDGNTVFNLYDTYGFPIDLTYDVAREYGLTIDEAGYEACMKEQKDRARSKHQFKADYIGQLSSDDKTQFTGYESFSNDTVVLSLIKDGKKVTSLSEGEKSIIVLEKTPFYAESGGQVGDQGYIHSTGGKFAVLDTQRQSDAILHYGFVEQGVIELGEDVKAEINIERRKKITKNHSAAHLLDAALCHCLGDHVQQKGSFVSDTYLRFDFSHPKPLSQDELSAATKIVNSHIIENTKVSVSHMQLDTALKQGAKALFTEKYDDYVRVLTMGSDNFSIELCGGTHVDRTGDIGLFTILSETLVASGVRRIEAITGIEALRHKDQMDCQLHEMSAMLNVSCDKLSEAVKRFIDASKEKEKTISKLQQQISHLLASNMVADVDTVEVPNLGKVNVLVKSVSGLEKQTFLNLSDQLRDKLGVSIIVLALESDSRVSIISIVSKAVHNFVKANELVAQLSSELGGRGGGKANFAQGGGTEVKQLPTALKKIQRFIFQVVR